MPVDPFTIGVALIGALRAFGRREPRRALRDVLVDDSGQVRLLWETRGLAGSIGRVLSEVQGPRAEEILTAYARRERELTEAERRGFAAVIQLVDDWRAAFRPVEDEPPDQGDEPGDGGFTDEDLVVGEPFGLTGGLQLTPVGVEDYFVPRFVRSAHKSIPGGAAGMAQQTPATLTRIGAALRGSFRGRVAGGRRRRSRAGPARRAAPRRRRKMNGSTKYNSAAWMAKIRKLRGKRRKK